MKARGFGKLSDEERRERASLGGKSVPPLKRYFSVNRDAAAENGRKGGLAKKRAAVEKDK